MSDLSFFVVGGWGPVRVIESMEWLRIETALECVFHPYASSDLGYRRVASTLKDTVLGTGLV